MALKEILRKQGIKELAEIFGRMLAKTALLVGVVTPVAVLGGPVAVAGTVVGLGVRLAVEAGTKIPPVKGSFKRLATFTLAAAAGAGIAGAIGGVALASAVGGVVGAVAGLAAFKTINLITKKVTENMADADPKSERHVQRYTTRLMHVTKYSTPAKLARLAGAFSMAAAITLPAYHYLDDIKNIPAVKQIYQKN